MGPGAETLQVGPREKGKGDESQTEERRQNRQKTGNSRQKTGWTGDRRQTRVRRQRADRSQETGDRMYRRQEAGRKEVSYEDKGFLTPALGKSFLFFCPSLFFLK